MAISSIQWTDYSFNPWIGCRKVAPECANCYAETLDRNRYSKTLAPGTKENPVSHWGSGPRHRTKTWGDPLKWNKQAGERQRLASFGHGLTAEGAAHYGHRPRVFCASLADWLDDENVPIEWFADLLKLIHDTPNLDWLLLTKRPHNWRARMEAAEQLLMERFTETGEGFEAWMSVSGWTLGTPPANVWIGVSAGADQAAALDIPARVHFLSCEPMLRPLDTTHAARFNWIIFGGESGSKARMCDVNWIRDGVEFCRVNKVAPFVKQLGSTNGQVWLTRDAGFGMPVAIKDPHGGEMEEWPEDLRVREFPTVRA